MAPKRKIEEVKSTPLKTKRTKCGEVLVTGSGDVGQLSPDALEKSRAALVKLAHEIVGDCACRMHTVCLTKNGKVLTFGCNYEGALGRVTDGKKGFEFTPEEFELPAALLEDEQTTTQTETLNSGLLLKRPRFILSQNFWKIGRNPDFLSFLPNFLARNHPKRAKRILVQKSITSKLEEQLKIAEPGLLYMQKKFQQILWHKKNGNLKENGNR